MPDHAALAHAVGVELLDPLHRLADAEELLMTANLAYSTVKDREPANQVQQSRRPAQGMQRAILRGDSTFALRLQGIEIGPCGGEIARKDRARFRAGQLPVDDGGNGGVRILLIAPCLPELLRRADRRIARFLPVHRQQHLGEVEQLRDVVLVLVAYELAASLLEALGWSLVFNHQHRDAIDEGDDVAALGLRGTGSLHREFGGDVEAVVLGRLPVDEAEGEALAVAIDGLGDGRAQDQCVVDILVGAFQPLQAIRCRLEATHGFMCILQVEAILSASMGEAVDAHHAFSQHVIQHNVAQPVAAQGEGLGLRQRPEAECHQHLQGRNLRLVFFCGVEAAGVGHHACRLEFVTKGCPESGPEYRLSFKNWSKALMSAWAAGMIILSFFTLIERPV